MNNKKENTLDETRIIPELIKANEIKKAYLLFGEERYLVMQQRDKLLSFLCDGIDEMNINRFSGANLNTKEIIDISETLPFFAARRVIVIEDSDLFKKSDEDFVNYMSELPDSTVFVFIEANVDARTSLYKAISKNGIVVKLSKQSDTTLASWVKGKIAREGKSIQQSVIMYFLKRTGDDMVRIENELEKVLSYTIDKPEITVSDINAVTRASLEDRIFDMIEAVSRKDKKNTFALYHDLIALRESPVKILSLIVSEYERLTLMKELLTKGKRGNDVSSIMGVKEFVVTKRLPIVSKYTLEELRDTFAQAVDAEQSFKSGRITDRMALELLLFSLVD